MSRLAVLHQQQALHAELVAEWPSALDSLAERINLQDLQGAPRGSNSLRFDRYAAMPWI